MGIDYDAEINSLEKQLAKDIKMRDEAKAVVDKYQSSINSTRKALGFAKSMKKASLMKEERMYKYVKYFPSGTLWENEKLNIDSKTKEYIKKRIFRNKDTDISIRELRLSFEKEVEKSGVSPRVDMRRNIFILNRTAEGMTLTEVAGLVGVSRERVRQILNSLFRKIRDPRFCRNLIIRGG